VCSRGVLFVAKGTCVRFPVAAKMQVAILLPADPIDSGFTSSTGACASSFSTPVTGYLPKFVAGTVDGGPEATTIDLENRDNSTVLSSGVMVMDAMLVYWQESILHRKARLDHETAKQNEQPEFVPVKENEKENEAYTTPTFSSARWSAFLASQ
jgi:hypothetical protein